jgi:hypothetical protein
VPSAEIGKTGEDKKRQDGINNPFRVGASNRGGDTCVESLGWTYLIISALAQPSVPQPLNRGLFDVWVLVRETNRLLFQ